MDSYIFQQNFITWDKRPFSATAYKQNIIWKISWILVRIFDGWFAMGRNEGWGGGSPFFSFLLSWKNCCIASAHSDANTPRRIVIFGWNGWTGAAGLSACSEPSPPPPPPPPSLGKSLQKVGYMSKFTDLQPQNIFFYFAHHSTNTIALHPSKLYLRSIRATS